MVLSHTIEKTTLYNPILYVTKLTGMTQSLPQDKEQRPDQMPAKKLSQHGVFHKEYSSLVNNQELAVQENHTTALF